MKKLLPLIFLFIAPYALFAQTNYKPGYVINTSGDTLRGVIDYREWNTNPQSISFKASTADQNTLKITPENARFFSIGDAESYLSYTGPITTDYIDPNHISSGRDTSFVTKSVFLKLLQKGPNVNVYAYNDDIKVRLYIQQTDDKAVKELGYRVYNDANGHTVNEDQYMKQLFALANKYDALSAGLQYDIEHMSYNTAAVLDVTAKINRLNKKQINYGTDAPRAAFFAGAGANVTIYNASGRYQLNGGLDHTSVLPMVSAGFDAFANPNTRRIIFRGEVAIQGSQYKVYYLNRVTPQIHINYQFTDITFSASPQLIYNLVNGNGFRFNIGAGALMSYHNYTSKQYNSTEGQVASDGIAPFDLISLNFQAMGRVGILLNDQIGINAYYLSRVGISNDSYFGLSQSGFQIGLNYYFTKAHK